MLNHKITKHVTIQLLFNLTAFRLQKVSFKQSKTYILQTKKQTFIKSY